MSSFSSVRLAMLGSVAAVALSGTAGAAGFSFGDVQISIDTTVSMGGSIKTEGRNTDFLSEGNGGKIDFRDGPGATFAAFPGPLVLNNATIPLLETTSPLTTGSLTATLNPDNYDGSVNGDDGRLNFDGGDLIGATLKASHDLQVKWQNYTVFARAVGFYDAVLNKRDVGARSLLTDQALGDVGRNYELLDLFISADYTIGDDNWPVNLRLGKQVINWGESTFIQGGNNVFNPIDVGAIRRPGSEIKEALVPVNAISGSISLPFDVSVSAYYALDWEPFELDPSGTPFSGVDVVALGSGLGGNAGAVSFTSGSPLSGMRRNCDASSAAGVQSNNAIAAGLLPPLVGATGDGKLNCSDASLLTGVFANSIDYRTNYTIGQHERVKLGIPQLLAGEGFTRPMQGITERDRSIFAGDDGQFGLSARYLADWLGGTEFGAYYQNYNSRLPFINVTRLGFAQVGFSVQGDATNGTSVTTAISGRGRVPAGCGFNTGFSGAGVYTNPFLGGTDTNPALTPAQAGAAITSMASLIAGAANVPVGDPMDLINGTVATNVSTATSGSLTLTPSGVGLDNVVNAFKLNCLAQYYQAIRLPVPLGGAVLQGNGAEGVGLSPQYGLAIEYPEDIQSWGASFNTTVFGIGLQGDFTYRPDAPFQVDTDSLTIWNAVSDCVITQLVGPVGALFAPVITNDGSGAPSCGNQRRSNPVIRNEMITAQIGTTMQMTGSDWLVEMLDADLATIVTEVGLAFVPGVEDTWLNNSVAQTGVQYAAISCQGSDLGLGSLVGFDSRKSKQCRTNDLSAGGVFLFTLQYNNFLDTGFVLSPQIVYSYDFEGSTPAPYSTYLEDRQAVALSLTGTLNNNLRLGASYSNFFGGGLRNKAKDQDFASLTASYSF